MHSRGPSTIISILMPVRNEIDHIGNSIRAVLFQNYDMGSLEIIIADGMSGDGTREIINKFRADHPKLKLIDNPGLIVSTGLNNALKHAKGDIIIRVDGHSEIAPDYVSSCVRHLQEKEVDAVGGPMETVGETTIAQVIALAMSSPFGVGNSSFRTSKNKSKLVDTVPFPAYRRETIDELGLFDEELVRNQDDEYNYRLRKFGGKVLLAEDVRARYYSRGSLSSLFKQYFQYGYWKVRVLQKHPAQMKPRQFVPLLFVLSLLVTILASLISVWGKLALSLILGSYFLSNLIASIWTARGKNWKFILALPFAFTILHLSYGIGFLVGLFRFIHRWGDKDGKVPTLQEVHA
jgi:glycosyltransferase involved in cell wall biosynthesis